LTFGAIDLKTKEMSPVAPSTPDNSDSKRRNLDDEIDRRLWEDDKNIGALAVDGWKEIFRFLLAANSGGAVAFLAWVPKSGAHPDCAAITMFFFVAGFVAAGAAMGLNAARFLKKSETFSKELEIYHRTVLENAGIEADPNAFYRIKREAREKLSKAVRWSDTDRKNLKWLIATSFVCFSVAAMMGVIILSNSSYKIASL
jgi:hypothetical protein